MARRMEGLGVLSAGMQGQGRRLVDEVWSYTNPGHAITQPLLVGGGHTSTTSDWSQPAPDWLGADGLM